MRPPGLAAAALGRPMVATDDRFLVSKPRTTRFRYQKSRRGGRRPVARRWRSRGGLSVLAVLAVLAAAALTLGGCTVVSALLDTQQALQRDGFQSVSVNYKFMTNGDGVTVSVAVGAPATPADVNRAAEVVWQHLHERFDFLQVSVHGTGSGAGALQQARYTFADMEAMFGARNPSWNKTSIRSSAEHLGVAVLIGIVAVVAVIVGIAVTLRRRKRRRRPPRVGGGGTGAPLWPAPPGPPWAPWAPVAPPPGAPPPGTGPGPGWGPPASPR